MWSNDVNTVKDRKPGLHKHALYDWACQEYVIEENVTCCWCDPDGNPLLTRHVDNPRDQAQTREEYAAYIEAEGVLEASRRS